MAVAGTAAATRGAGTAASAPVVSGAASLAGGSTQALRVTDATSVTAGRAGRVCTS